MRKKRKIFHDISVTVNIKINTTKRFIINVNHDFDMSSISLCTNSKVK